MRNRWFIFALVAALTLGLTACSSNNQGTTPTSQPQAQTQQPAAGTPASTPAATQPTTPTQPGASEPTPAEPTAGPATANPADAFGGAKAALDALTSYEYSTKFLFVTADTDEVQSGSIELTGIVAGSDRKHLTWRDMQTNQSFEVIQVGNQAWIRNEEGWEEVPVLVAEGMSQVALVYAPSATWGGLFGELQPDASYVGREDVNGVSADHFAATYTQWGTYWRGQLSDATGNVWIAEAGYPVKYEFAATGVSEDGVRGEVTWTMDLTNVNQPLTVEPPVTSPEPSL